MRLIDGDALFCKFWSLADPYVKQDKVLPSKIWNQAATMAREAPTLTTPNEWVSVEERLPEKKQDVLMLFKSGNMAVGWWHDVDEHVTFWCAYTDDGFYTDCDDMPVYWMPLPAPPDHRPPEGEDGDANHA